MEGIHGSVRIIAPASLNSIAAMGATALRMSLSTVWETGILPLMCVPRRSGSPDSNSAFNLFIANFVVNGRQRANSVRDRSCGENVSGQPDKAEAQSWVASKRNHAASSAVFDMWIPFLVEMSLGALRCRNLSARSDSLTTLK